MRARSRHIPSSVRRRVAVRDGHRCTYVDEQGRRCEERAFLEYDHAVPFALGGARDEGSVRLRCRAHNRHAAAEAFGEAFMRRKVEEARARE